MITSSSVDAKARRDELSCCCCCCCSCMCLAFAHWAVPPSLLGESRNSWTSRAILISTPAPFLCWPSLSYLIRTTLSIHSSSATPAWVYTILSPRIYPLPSVLFLSVFFCSSLPKYNGHHHHKNKKKEKNEKKIIRFKIKKNVWTAVSFTSKRSPWTSHQHHLYIGRHVPSCFATKKYKINCTLLVGRHT